MNTLNNNPQLRADLFLTPTASAEIFRTTLQAARRRNRQRFVSRAAFLVLAIGTCTLSFVHRSERPSQNKVLRTGPAIPHRIIHSEPLQERIGSASYAPVTAIRTTQIAHLTFSTASFGYSSVHPISDEQLLAFFPGQAVAIVHPVGQNAELLMFSEPMQ